MKNYFRIPWAPPSFGLKEQKAVEKVMRSNWMTQGEKTWELEKEICKVTNSKFAVVTNNGTAALICSLLANEIGSGDEVLVPSFTFVATVNAILAAGAKPILVDCDPLTFNTTPELMRKKISKKTRAIIPVDVAGMPIEIDYFQEFAKKNNLILIEDSAESLGAEYKNRKIGSFGQTAIFSLHMAKIVTAIEGGAIITNQKDIAEKARLIRSHGDVGGYNSIYFGLNFRISDLHSAIALEQMKKLNQFLKYRNKLAKIYKEELIEFEFQKIPKNVTLHPYMLFGVLLKSNIRNKVINYLNKKGIETRICWKPVHLQKYFSKKLRYHLPNSEQIYSRIINLPMGNGLTENQVIQVSKLVKKAIQDNK